MSKKPLTIILFGATGDLFQKKILPAFEHLFETGVFPKDTKFVAYGRRVFDDRAFQQFLGLHSRKEKFLSHFSYVSGKLDDSKGFAALRERVESLGTKERDTLIYISLPPKEVAGVVQKLGVGGLLKMPSGKSARILIEKPFGDSLLGAKKLNILLRTFVSEKNIFRIDHYLEKGVVEAVLSFRRANPLFEKYWSGKYIEKVHLSLIETADVSTRASFYDSVGAFLDVGQNHLLAMLGNVGMALPKTSPPKKVQSARSAVFRRLTLPARRNGFIRGQYAGYREEKGVRGKSTTETFFSFPVEIADPRFRGIPFYLTAGKALHENRAEIDISFRDGSVLTFRIQPNGDIVFTPAKDTEKVLLPSSALIRPKTISNREPYERIFIDALAGDQERFVSADETTLQWKFAEQVKKKLKKVPLTEYRKGMRPRFKE